MMNKALRFIEILWLGVAAVSAVEIYVNWGTDWQNTIKFTLFWEPGYSCISSADDHVLNNRSKKHWNIFYL